jgi:hypothetical protein
MPNDANGRLGTQSSMHAPAFPHGESARNALMRRWALALIAAATLARLGLAAVLPVGVDEAYSIGIARQFSLSYFDHPPLHLWLVGAWAKMWGSEDLLLLRLPFIALGALSSWLMYALGTRLFGPVAGLWATAIFNLAPVFGLAHGALIFPDGPAAGRGTGNGVAGGAHGARAGRRAAPRRVGAGRAHGRAGAGCRNTMACCWCWGCCCSWRQPGRGGNGC